ncbi:hypothetical protein EDD18DRAFT_1089680, partial [Armillaria luteobubalina]
MHRYRVIILILPFITRTFGAQTYSNNDKGVPACSKDQRTVLRIIWRCLATILPCTWLAVHPNVPGRSITTNGRISSTIEHTKIMLIAILAPEIIVGWAARQFSIAWKLRHAIQSSMEQEEESRLTLAHGFLLCMGGFYYTCSTSARETLDIPGTLVTLEALESEPNLVKRLAAISPETIEDKSKGDALSKLISTLQLLWFIVQCVARVLQHLPIMLLEMTALAFAGLSIITYSLWWYKPLNVK